jgi:hypothetical protein
MTSRQTWIVSPVYHDVESFIVLRERVRAALELMSSATPTQFIVVDDTAGRDPEISTLDAFDDVQVLRPPFNLGHQRALVFALRSLRKVVDEDDLVVTMDADGEDQPIDVPRLLHAVAATPADPWRLVVARRTRRQESPGFKVFYVCFRLLFRLLTGRTVRSGNFAAFTGRYLQDMLLHPYFDLCYSSTLISLSRDPTYVPCERGTRYAGESRMGLEKLLAHGVRMLMPFADRIAIRSLAFFAMAAGLTTVVGTFTAIVGIMSQFETPSWLPWMLGAGALISSLALVNFLVMFSGFVQSMALAFTPVDESRRGVDVFA